MQNADRNMGTLEPSGVGSRIGSYLLDALIFISCLGIACAVIFACTPKEGRGVSIIVLVLIAWFFYFPLMESSERQATLGKMAAHLKVVDGAGNRIGLLRATGRNLVKAFCVFIGFLKLVSFIVLLCNERRKSIHDFVTSTCVIHV